MKNEILKDKILLAEKIRDKWTKADGTFNPPHGYYWSGYFTSPSKALKVYIYFQRYVRGYKRMKVNYVKINWSGNEGITEHKPLLVQEIKTLLKSFANNDLR